MVVYIYIYMCVYVCYGPVLFKRSDHITPALARPGAHRLFLTVDKMYGVCVPTQSPAPGHASTVRAGDWAGTHTCTGTHLLSGNAAYIIVWLHASSVATNYQRYQLLYNQFARSTTGLYRSHLTSSMYLYSYSRVGTQEYLGCLSCDNACCVISEYSILTVYTGLVHLLWSGYENNNNLGPHFQSCLSSGLRYKYG